MDFEIDNFNALHAALNEMCADLLSRSVPDEKVFDCKLVATELLSNVLQHGGGKAFFRAGVSGDEIVLSVKSEYDYRPPEYSACAGVLQEYGRGLFLVDCYCVRREYNETEGIKAVIKFEK